VQAATIVGKFRETKDPADLYRSIKDRVVKEQKHILNELRESTQKFDVL
jgi:hypothetical protein